MSTRRLAGIIASIALSTAFQAGAQTYPARPIRVILGIGVGSPTDVTLRAAGQELAASLGQPLVIENRPGGNLMIAPEACAKSAPDGYTLCVFSNAAVTLNPFIFSKLTYDPDKDFTPVALLWYLIQGLLATPSLPANSIKELEALARTRPINFGTMGDGTAGDVMRQWLNDFWKTSMTGIPYKGANFVTSALLSGEVQVSRISLNGLASQVKAGKLKVLAIGSSKRSRLFPDAPTYAEAGLASFPDERVWWGMFAPAGTPDAMVKRVNGEFARLFRSPKFAEYLENGMMEPVATPPEEFAAFLKEDRERAGQVVKKYNIPKQ